MKYSEFKGILNKAIFEESKSVLLTKISKYPYRYMGLFRPTKPKAKLLQNLLQSHEIRFGNAFEKLIEKYLEELGFEILDKTFEYESTETVKIDHFFRKGDNYFLVEQKIRDDHDSSKKTGQLQNFEKKLAIIISKYDDKNITGLLYFIDPNLTKNRKFYEDEFRKMENDYKIRLQVCYGRDFFELINAPQIWNEIEKYLKKWRKELPEFPELNFDKNPTQTFNEIKDLPPNVFRKLLGDEVLYNEIVLTIFPEQKTLVLLKEYFKTKKQKIYKSLVEKLENRGI